MTDLTNDGDRLSEDQPYGDIEVYKHAPELYASFDASNEGSPTSQWDLAERVIEAVTLTSSWHKPLAVHLTFDTRPGAPAQTSIPRPIVIRSRKASPDLVHKSHDMQLHQPMETDEIDGPALRAAFATGLGAPDDDTARMPWNESPITWSGITVEASRTLVGSPAGVDQVTIHNSVGSRWTAEIIEEPGGCWVDAPRRTMPYVPIHFAFGLESFAPLIDSIIFPWWSLYGHINGQQTNRIHDYLAKLSDLGWETGFRPSAIEPPFYQSYLKAEQQIEAARLEREARQPKKP